MAEPSKYVRVRRLIAYLAKKTTKKYKKGHQVSLVYAKRYPKNVVKTEWMLIDQRKLMYDPILKHQTYGEWVNVAKQRLTHYEHILRMNRMTDRSVANMLARHKVYRRIWENDRGIVRVTINGHSEGRRIKVVLHLGYMRRIWEQKHKGYEQFKKYILSRILESLRRRGLRLSNPKESKERVFMLRRWLGKAVDSLETIPTGMKQEQLKQIKGLTRLIKQQKKSRQVLGGTIRIEKLVSM